MSAAVKDQKQIRREYLDRVRRERPQDLQFYEHAAFLCPRIWPRPGIEQPSMEEIKGDKSGGEVK
jgi:hypothetical protein